MKMTETAGIFFFNNDYKLLIGHPTGSGSETWSIPKGKLEKYETSFEAAIRETFEETNVQLSLLSSHYELPFIKYKNAKKKLKAFVIFENENNLINSNNFDLKCNSLVEKDSKWNAGLPEMDNLKFVTIEEAKQLLHETQIVCLDIIQELINNKNG